MLDLLDWRRQVFALYRFIREAGSDTPEAWAQFQQVRHQLFAEHPQSPLDSTQKRTFTGLRYHPYQPEYRITATMQAVEKRTYEADAGDDGTVKMHLIGTVAIALPTGTGQLGVYWIGGYGGGIFIPFRDATNGKQTYGGGRYLLDTIKGADLGSVGDKLVLDFNYAYHPSCYYNAKWTCPLAPMQNRLSFAVDAGETLLTD